MKKTAAALATLALLVIAAPAEARVRIGTLVCDVAPGVSFVVGSQKDVACTFNPTRGRLERYSGRITRIGVDVGFTKGGKIGWAVFAAGDRHASLAGVYGGASAEATVGVGGNANVLVGGFGRSIILQPISVGTQRGLDAALAVSGLRLESGRRWYRHR